MKDDKVKNA